MKTILKITGLIVLLIIFIVILLGSRIIFIFWPAQAKLRAAALAHIFGKIAVSILCIDITVIGRKELLNYKGALYISNHLSYIDGIIVTALLAVLFIAKTEIKKWPLFGLFTILSNTIFIKRSETANIQEELKKVTASLRAGVNVIMFPEGTSSDGSGLLPFKSSFFATAVEAGTPVIPMVIKYKQINSLPLDESNKNLVYWYGNMYFFPHLLKVCALDKVNVQVHICEPITIVADPSQNAAQQRKALCDAAREVIENQLQNFTRR